ncbi:M28 family metallopeptidase [Aurantiacibacter rhizosphaerae]|uniref:M28 family peptidase n=1 Tax=Aurantiacibacter rhizosphaerae TaxID=2691582 RepID=A0A844X9P8_9SPHN|nr:M28 family metallopeptidase [Aurantiacibacter rhizosphaerae]MWV26509.1 M28 family peptidase [Aurantiacibacter rhizosphaerae]
MLRFTSPLAVLSLAACATVPAGTPTAPISLETVQENVRTLSSDAFEGRKPGTPGGQKTVDYLVQQFAAAGLQPGNGDSYLQKVPLVEITGSDFAPLTVGDLSFEHGKDWVGVSYRQVPATTIADSELVFVGYGINAPERGWNDYAGVDMTGKTALILINDADFAEDTLEGPFNGRAMTYYGRWTYKYEEAARQGATAALIVHEDFAASYGWNVVEGSWTGAQAYTDTGGDGSDQTAMNGWVSNDTAAAIFQAAGMDLGAMVQAASQPGFKAVSLGMPVATSFTNSSRRYTSNNVIGILPGATRPDEIVLHTAHWDHLGRCIPNDAGDDICNGAVDNATGTAALVALAQAQHQSPPLDRSLVFLAVTAEESGLLGAEYYAANPVYPLSQTVGGINMDGIAVRGETRDVNVRGGGKSELDDYLAAALAAQGRTASPDPAPEAGYYYRSDHFPLVKRGVPMFYVKSGLDLVDGGTARGEALEAEYRASAYHAPDDEYDENWDWSGLMQDLDLYYRLARALGSTTDWPEWNEGDEFRAVRQASCAASEEGC